MIWLTLLFIAFCAAVALAPQEATQAALAGVWALMALAAVVLPVLAFFRVF